MAAPARSLCQATVCSHRVCPNYAGGPFYDQYCFKHTSSKRVQPDPETCQVCLEDMPVEYRTGCCKSVFCRSCLTNHSKAGGVDCPKCRAPMGLDQDGEEYLWLNLTYQSKALKKDLKGIPFLGSKEALGQHMISRMDAEKAELEGVVKKMCDDMMKAVQDTYAERVAQWNNNTDGWQDMLWDDAQAVPRMVENINVIRSARYKDREMGKAGLRLVKAVRETLERLTQNDILDAEETLMPVVRTMTDEDEGEEDSEDSEEDDDYEDSESSEGEDAWETESGSV